MTSFYISCTTRGPQKGLFNHDGRQHFFSTVYVNFPNRCCSIFYLRYDRSTWFFMRYSNLDQPTCGEQAEVTCWCQTPSFQWWCWLKWLRCWQYFDRIMSLICKGFSGPCTLLSRLTKTFKNAHNLYIYPGSHHEPVITKGLLQCKNVCSLQRV